MDQKIERQIEELKNRTSNLERNSETDYKSIQNLVERTVLYDQMLNDAAARIGEIHQLIAGLQNLLLGIGEGLKNTDVWN